MVSFIGGGNPSTHRNLSTWPQVITKLDHIMLYTSPWLKFELTTSVVIGTDCIGSCKSNYHTITTAPTENITRTVIVWHRTAIKLLLLYIYTLIKENVRSCVYLQCTLYFYTCLTPPHLCACLKPGPGFPMPYVVVLFLYSVSSVEMRGDCSFCWYWWNCWPSVFNLSLHRSMSLIN